MLELWENLTIRILEAKVAKRERQTQPHNKYLAVLLALSLAQNTEETSGLLETYTLMKKTKLMRVK